MYGIMLPVTQYVSIGGSRGQAQGCIIPSLTMGSFKMNRVFMLAFPFTDWLVRHIIIGANVMNNWDFTISRTDNAMRFTEKIPPDAPNKTNPYQNYFEGAMYVAVQDEAADDQ